MNLLNALLRKQKHVNTTIGFFVIFVIERLAMRTAGKATSLFFGRQYEDLAALTHGLSFNRFKRPIPQIMLVHNFDAVILFRNLQQHNPIILPFHGEVDYNPPIRVFPPLALPI